MTKISKPSLAETHPELAAQSDGWDPTTLTAYSGKKVGWKCEFGHSWSATIASRSNGNGCSICSNRTVLVGFNDLEKRGAILGHKAGIEKFDGYSEAWTKKSLSVTSIKQIINWVYEDED